jgi:hypothetical protein
MYRKISTLIILGLAFMTPSGARALTVNADGSVTISRDINIVISEGDKAKWFDEFIYFTFPPNFHYCRNEITIKSYNPDTKNYRPKFQFTEIEDDRATFRYAVIQPPIRIGGRSWLEARVSVIGVQDRATSSAKCSPITGHAGLAPEIWGDLFELEKRFPKPQQ